MKVHVLTTTGNQVRLVVHGPTPAGHNAGGVGWAEALVAAGRNVSVLPPGNAPYQITPEELAMVQKGILMEVSGDWLINLTWSAGQYVTELDKQADKMLADAFNKFVTELQYYGFVREETRNHVCLCAETMQIAEHAIVPSAVRSATMAETVAATESSNRTP